MRNILRCRRGSAAFATVVALIPLIGAMALGGEAGSWYVVHQQAQNAADAAAYSGALRWACSLSTSCTDTNTVTYRGKEFAAQSAFCNTGDTTYPGSKCGTLASGISQSVQIASLTTWNGTSGQYVQATISQTQPTYLAKVLGINTVTVGATAVAKVQALQKAPCVLALTGSLSFQGSPNINAPNCGMASDDTATNALDFTGGGMTLNVGSLSAAGGCTGAASFCNTAHTYMPPVNDPFTALDTDLTSLCGSNPTLPASCGLATCPGSTLVAYTATSKCTNNGLHITGNTAESLCGVYFISGTLKITGNPTIQNSSTCSTGGGGVTFIMLPGATINNQGNAVINITAPTASPAASSLPTALQSQANLFQYMAIYDASSTAVQFGGNSNITVQGNIYAPTASVTFQGDPTMSVSGQSGKCGELIAASVAFNGNATFDSTGCPSQTQVVSSSYVQMVQ